MHELRNTGTTPAIGVLASPGPIRTLATSFDQTVLGESVSASHSRVMISWKLWHSCILMPVSENPLVFLVKSKETQWKPNGNVAKYDNFPKIMTRKISKILRKNDFRKKIIFFLVRKVMLILHLPHIFLVCGCWGGSNTIDFAIFRVSGTPKSMISANSCPSRKSRKSPEVVEKPSRFFKFWKP